MDFIDAIEYINSLQEIKRNGPTSDVHSFYDEAMKAIIARGKIIYLENEELKRQIQIKNNYMKLILDILYDYDGYFSRETNEGSAKDLADLIDETCDYLKKAILNDDKSDVYLSYVDDEQHLT